MCDTQIAQRGCDLSGNISLRSGGQLQICRVSSGQTSLESNCEIVESVAEHAADAPHHQFLFYLYFTGKNVKCHIDTTFVFTYRHALEATVIFIACCYRLQDQYLLLAYVLIITVKTSLRSLICGSLYLEQVKRPFAIGVFSHLLPDEDASYTTLLFLRPQPYLAPLSGCFLMLGSSADTFWGKGFLATALGTASPDRKKTHRGQNVWTSSGSEKQRESAHMEDLSAIGISVGGAKAGFIIFKSFSCVCLVS